MSVPQYPTDALANPEAKQLRYYLRLAAAENISCRPADLREQAVLVKIANERDRNHPNPQYQVEDADNSDLMERELWILAEDDTGRTLLIAVIAVDGEFAVLRYFRTQGDSEKHSLSRYSAHWAVVETLSELGVQWLIDSQPPGSQTNGVRLIQRNLGFRHVRIRKPGRRPYPLSQCG